MMPIFVLHIPVPYKNNLSCSSRPVFWQHVD